MCIRHVPPLVKLLSKTIPVNLKGERELKYYGPFHPHDVVTPRHRPDARNQAFLMPTTLLKPSSLENCRIFMESMAQSTEPRLPLTRSSCPRLYEDVARSYSQVQPKFSQIIEHLRQELNITRFNCTEDHPEFPECLQTPSQHDVTTSVLTSAQGPKSWRTSVGSQLASVVSMFYQQP